MHHLFDNFISSFRVTGLLVVNLFLSVTLIQINGLLSTILLMGSILYTFFRAYNEYKKATERKKKKSEETDSES